MSKSTTKAPTDFTSTEQAVFPSNTATAGYVALADDADNEDELLNDEAVYDLSAVKYRHGTSENDQLVLVLNAASGQCKEKYRTQLWNLFFGYMCCVIASNIMQNEPKGKESDLYKKAYAMFVGIDAQGYTAILRGGHGLFAVAEPKMPEYVVTQVKEFITNPIKSKGTKSTFEDEGEKGKIIWRTFQKIKAYIINIANIYVRDIKSGENRTGVLLEIREKLWIIDSARKRLIRLNREATSKCGKGKFSNHLFILIQYFYQYTYVTIYCDFPYYVCHNLLRFSNHLFILIQYFTNIGPSFEKQRKDYVLKELESNVLPQFDPDWFPQAWLVFVLLGGASEHVSNISNPFRPRSTKDMVEEEKRKLQDLAAHDTTKPQSKTVRRNIRAQLPDSAGSVKSSDAVQSKSVSVTVTLDKQADSLSGTKEKIALVKDKVAILKENLVFLKDEMKMSDDSEEVVTAKRELMSAFKSIYDIETKNPNHVVTYAQNRKRKSLSSIDQSADDAISIGSSEEISMLNDSFDLPEKSREDQEGDSVVLEENLYD